MGNEPPKYNPQTRKRIAIAKYYGLDGREWSFKEISDELNISTRQAQKYVQESSMGAEAEQMLAEKEAQARLSIYQTLQKKLDSLNEIEEELLEQKNISPSSYKLETARGMVGFDNVPNMQLDYDEATIVETDVPVPDDYVEVTDVDELKDVWREQRQVIEQMEDLLGLEEPEQIEETSQQIVDVKHWSMSGESNNDLPDQEVIDVGEDGIENEDDLSLPDGDVVDE